MSKDVPFKETTVAMPTVNVMPLVDEYIDESEWRAHENANAGYSYASLLNHLSGTVIAKYTLEKYYKGKIADAHTAGFIHLHDLSSGIIPYCAGWSLKELLKIGFRGQNGRATASPPKHLDSALQQIENFMATLQTEWAGAQAFNSFDTLLAPFVKHDKLSYTEVKQKIQSFIFGLNIASRWGQSPFTNLSFDWVCPEDLKYEPIIIGGQEDFDHFYGDYQEEANMINKAFLEVMLDGDAEGRVFSFPIPTYNITKDFPWESENAQLLFKATGKYGLPYFQNFINSDLSPRDVRSMCCRLQMDLRELKAKTGGLFGAGDKTGSIGVVTLNMPRIGFLYKGNKEGFFKKIHELLEIAIESLEIKRVKVSENLKKGLMPYSSIYLDNFDHHFSTVGLNGMNECCQNFFGGKEHNIVSQEGRALAIEVLDYMREFLKDAQEKTGHIYNLEATPAEGTTYRFARLDRKAFGDVIIQSGTAEAPFYTNSTQLPVDYTSDMLAALNLQEELQSKYTGGTVLHLFLGESIKDPTVVARLVKKIATNYHIPYFTLTPTFSICPVHGYISGAHETCPYDVYNHKADNVDLNE